MEILHSSPILSDTIKLISFSSVAALSVFLYCCCRTDLCYRMLLSVWCLFAAADLKFFLLLLSLYSSPLLRRRCATWCSRCGYFSFSLGMPLFGCRLHACLFRSIAWVVEAELALGHLEKNMVVSSCVRCREDPFRVQSEWNCQGCVFNICPSRKLQMYDGAKNNRVHGYWWSGRIRIQFQKRQRRVQWQRSAWCCGSQF